jgi:transcription-repair coupling factor (superfamily II helicase)
MPPRAKALMNSIRIKWIATALESKKLVMKQGKMIGYFISDQQSDYLSIQTFSSSLAVCAKNSSICKMKKNKLRLVCDCY